MHISIIKGDYLFSEWKDNSWKDFNKQVNELRKLGYRKIDQEYGWVNYYEFYKKKGKKKVITLTMLCM